MDFCLLTEIIRDNLRLMWIIIYYYQPCWISADYYRSMCDSVTSRVLYTTCIPWGIPRNHNQVVDLEQEIHLQKTCQGKVICFCIGVSCLTEKGQIFNPWGFLDAFAKLLEAAIGFVMSVCQSVRMIQLGSYWTDFHAIWRLDFLWHLWRQFNFH
jgi:hypothetical protein